MKKFLEAKWNEAARTGEPVPLGRDVVCDFCSKDFTDSDATGGQIFESKGVCPECEPRHMESVRRYGEEQFIRARCPPGMSFADFIRAARGPDAAIHIRGLHDG